MRRGQATLEYFILFAVMAAVVVLLFYYPKGNLQAVLENYISGG